MTKKNIESRRNFLKTSFFASFAAKELLNESPSLGSVSEVLPSESSSASSSASTSASSSTGSMEISISPSPSGDWDD